MLKTKTKTNKIKFENKKTNMKKQNIKQNIPPSPALIRQLNAMWYIISNDMYCMILLIVKKVLFKYKFYIFLLLERKREKIREKFGLIQNPMF